MFNTHACEANLWTAGQLSRDHVEYLRGLPQRIEVEDFTLVHASPRDPVWEYVITKDTASENYSYFDTKRCLVGHPISPCFAGSRASARSSLAFREHVRASGGAPVHHQSLQRRSTP